MMSALQLLQNYCWLDDERLTAAAELLLA